MSTRPRTPHPGLRSSMLRAHRARLAANGGLRDQTGSLLMAILFTIIMMSLVLVSVATIIAAQNKTRASRDFATALQAADAAYSDAMIKANSTWIDATHFGQTAVGATVSNSGTLSNINWTWTATRTNARTWDVVVTATGAHIDRAFDAHFYGTSVSSAKVTAVGADSAGVNRTQIAYSIDAADHFAHGFFSDRDLTMTGAPELDGYNGVPGTAGANYNLNLGSATIDRLEVWNTDIAGTSRCTGNTCATSDVLTYKPALDFPADQNAVNACNTGVAAAWFSSGGTALVPGTCYQSITFDKPGVQNYTGTVYAYKGVTIKTGATVNTSSTAYNSDATKLQIIALGTGTAVNQQPNSQVAMAIYAPNATCTLTAGTDATYDTRFNGAAVCKSLTVSGNVRLRYDGNLQSINPNTGTRVVYYMNAYQQTS